MFTETPCINRNNNNQILTPVSDASHNLDKIEADPQATTTMIITLHDDEGDN